MIFYQTFQRRKFGILYFLVLKEQALIIVYYFIFVRMRKCFTISQHSMKHEKNGMCSFSNKDYSYKEQIIKNGLQNIFE